MKDTILEEKFDPNQSPLIAFAIHDGHYVRPEVENKMKISEEGRFREEDPYTGFIAKKFDNHVVCTRSRFEFDLNRLSEKAVYQKPEDAWGLDIYNEPLSEDEVNQSLNHYQDFYNHAESRISQIIETYGFAVVFDLHSYNYRRNGPQEEADPAKNPDIDILTAGLDKAKWAKQIHDLKQFLSDYAYAGKELDVREEVRFDGNLSYFMQWMIKKFGDRIFIPSIELKKVFMDEWTGEVYENKLNHLSDALLTAGNKLVKEVIMKREKNEFC